MAVLVGKLAPHFSAKAVINGDEVDENFSLAQYKDEKYVVLFFYPKDFSFVSPTELHAFQAALPEFEKRSTQIIACSTDTEQSHWGWLQLPKDKGGIQGITYPIVADTNKTISANFDVLDGTYEYNEDGNLTASAELVAYRGLFLIDKRGVVQHQVVNAKELESSVDEALRMVDALQYYEAKGEVGPVSGKV